MVQIIPAILSKTEEEYKTDISRLALEQSLLKGWVHIDFADNKFVQNETIKPDVISKFPANFQKEAHLMVSHPKDWIDGLVKAEFKRVVFHIECEDDIDEVIDLIKSEGIEIGLAIKMDTPLEKLEPYISKINMVLIMSIIPGFQGQSFIEESLQRIKQVKLKWDINVGVDGAVGDKNVKQLVDAGVDNLTVGSFLLKGDLEENLEKLWEAIYE